MKYKEPINIKETTINNEDDLISVLIAKSRQTVTFHDFLIRILHNLEKVDFNEDDRINLKLALNHCSEFLRNVGNILQSYGITVDEGTFVKDLDIPVDDNERFVINDLYNNKSYPHNVTQGKEEN